MKPRKKPRLVSDEEKLIAARKMQSQITAAERAKGTSDALPEGGIIPQLQKLQTGALDRDVQSYRALFYITKIACSFLMRASLVNPHEQKRLARKSKEWPVLLPFHPQARERTVAQVAKLPLAEGTAQRTSLPGKKPPYSLDTPANIIIERVLDNMRLEHPGRYDLAKEKVTGTVLDSWFEDIWNRFSKLQGIWKNPRIRELGMSSAEAKKATHPVGTPSYEANVRDGVKHRLRAAFDAQFSPKK